MHFDYVLVEDLERVGMGGPGARRLLDAVKKRRTQQRRRSLITRLIPASKTTVGKSRPAEPSLTCLIQDKDVRSVVRSFYNNCVCSINT